MRRYLLGMGWVLLIACNLTIIPPTATPPPLPTPAPTATPTPAPAAPDWNQPSNGIEQRVLRPDNELTFFQTLRLDPAQWTFRVHYTPGTPYTLGEWRERLPEADVIVNANFFTPEHTVLGLLVSDGVRYGDPYRNRGGMFAVQNGTPQIRSNTRDPYRGETLEQAIQAFPMLVYDGAPAYNNPSQNRNARRTVIGQDAQGRIILMATPAFGIGLYDMSQWLPTTDLNLTRAFNLDGGGSVMMMAGDEVAIPSFDPVPAVLAAYPRGN